MDIFGDTEPGKMPGHFFSRARAIHRDSAIRADVGKQNYSVCPRHWYLDADFACERCGQAFSWTAQEQKTWFEDYFFWVDSQPRHCGTCRADLRRMRALRQEYDATVATARKRGSHEAKRRIVAVVTELQRSFGNLPERMIETKERFERQMRTRAGPGER